MIKYYFHFFITKYLLYYVYIKMYMYIIIHVYFIHMIHNIYTYNILIITYYIHISEFKNKLKIFNFNIQITYIY